MSWDKLPPNWRRFDTYIWIVFELLNLDIEDLVTVNWVWTVRLTASELDAARVTWGRRVAASALGGGHKPPVFSHPHFWGVIRITGSPKLPNDSTFVWQATAVLVMLRIQLDTYGYRAFAVVGPTVWNALGNDLCDPDLSITYFGHLLKTHLFQQYTRCTLHRVHERHCAIMRQRYIHWHWHWHWMVEGDWGSVNVDNVFCVFL